MRNYRYELVTSYAAYLVLALRLNMRKTNLLVLRSKFKTFCLF